MFPNVLVKEASKALLRRLPKPTKRDAVVALGTLGVAAGGKRLVEDIRMAEQLRAQQRQYGGQGG